MPKSPLHEPVLSWYERNARDLPWRAPRTSPWAILVSELMLQQTPVNRVLPVYADWLSRWPEPRDLAASAPGEAIRTWGRLGYPRRALRLHDAATVIVEKHGGRVPPSYDDLLALPGVGAYTAAAVASFAFGTRHAVLDTNVRRVLARAVGGAEQPVATLTRAERARADFVVPDADPLAARWAAAVMELGALVCTARRPRCGVCPLIDQCAWYHSGKPAFVGRQRPAQAYAGTDRQVRGIVLALLRKADGPVDAAQVAGQWPDVGQLERALASLLADNLVECTGDSYVLPGVAPA